ncbi:MAG TPA: DUF503 domain-containing protein [Actinomycetospora sp.]|nr:DUF503 domain-containing protein [Actinomycetospora sp.]
MTAAVMHAARERMDQETVVVVAMVGIALHLPGCGSLKEKRGVIKALIARLRRDLNISIAEIGDQDAWRHCQLGVAVVAGSEVGARKVVQQVEKIVYREPRVEPVSIAVEITAPEPR